MIVALRDSEIISEWIDRENVRLLEGMFCLNLRGFSVDEAIYISAIPRLRRYFGRDYHVTSSDVPQSDDWAVISQTHKS